MYLWVNSMHEKPSLFLLFFVFVRPVLLSSFFGGFTRDGTLGRSPSFRVLDLARVSGLETNFSTSVIEPSLALVLYLLIASILAGRNMSGGNTSVLAPTRLPISSMP